MYSYVVRVIKAVADVCTSVGIVAHQNVTCKRIEFLIVHIWKLILNKLQY